MPKFQVGDWVSLAPGSRYLTIIWRERLGRDVVRISANYPDRPGNFRLAEDIEDDGWHPCHLMLAKPKGPPETTREMSYFLLSQLERT